MDEVENDEGGEMLGLPTADRLRKFVEQSEEFLKPTDDRPMWGKVSVKAKAEKIGQQLNAFEFSKLMKKSPTDDSFKEIKRKVEEELLKEELNKYRNDLHALESASKSAWIAARQWKRDLDKQENMVEIPDDDTEVFQSLAEQTGMENGET